MTDNEKDFDLFLEEYPEKIATVSLKPNELKKIAAEVSKEYSTFLKEQGVAGYDNGFIWSVNPEEFNEVLAEDWGLDAKELHVVARTAFGDLFLWSGSEVLMLQVNYNKLSEFGESIPFLYDFMLTDGDYMRDALYRDLFDEALEKLGPLAADECYGFSPAIPLGGEENANNLQKVKLIPYLSILAQAQR